MPRLIVVYDFQAERTSLPRKFLRQYLTHVQYSVFEGDVTKGDAKEIKQKLKQMREPGESVIIYDIYNPSLDRTVYGDDELDDNKFIE